MKNATAWLLVCFALCPRLGNAQSAAPLHLVQNDFHAERQRPHWTTWTWMLRGKRLFFVAGLLEKWPHSK